MPEEKQLIQPLQVERDEYGFWTHPAWPDDGDEGNVRAHPHRPKARILVQGRQMHYLSNQLGTLYLLGPRRPAIR